MGMGMGMDQNNPCNRRAGFLLFFIHQHQEQPSLFTVNYQL
jgi:hypothetical protein